MKAIGLRTLMVFACSVAVGAIAGIAVKNWWFPSGNHDSPSSMNTGVDHRLGSSSAAGGSARSSRSGELSKVLQKTPRAQRYLWLASQTETASLAEMNRLYRLAGTEGHTDLQRAIAARWAALDPAHMFQALKGDPEYEHRIVRILFEQWAQSDPEGALELVVANKKNKSYRRWGIALWSELMKHAPGTGIAAHDRLGILGYIPDTEKVRDWAKDDPQAAAEHLMSAMESQAAGRETMMQIAQVWGESDPEAALTFGLQVKDRSYRYTLLVNSMRAWGQSDPKAAAEYIASQTDFRVRATLGTGLVAGLAKTDPMAALAWADENLESSARINAVSEAVETMAKEDIQSAAEIVAGMDPGGTMNYAVSQIVRDWADQGVIDNDPLWHWIGSLSDTEARERAVEGLERRLQLRGSGGLVDLVAGQHGHLATSPMVERAARQKARQDPQSAAQWASALPEDRSNTALNAVMNYWRDLSPDEASSWELAQGQR